MDSDRPYTDTDFESIAPIDRDTTVGELVERLRSEFGLPDLLPAAKSELELNVDRLVPAGLPLRCATQPGYSPGGHLGLHLAAPARIALALLLRDIVLPALTAPAEPTEGAKPRKRKKLTA